MFARKENNEIMQGSRIWVLPGILLLLALIWPVLARFTPEILSAMAGCKIRGITIPPPTYLDAYAQWITNLSQIARFALILIYGRIVSADVKSGTAALVLTKPVSHFTFVTPKATVRSAFLAVCVAAGTLLTCGVTDITFGKAPGAALWSSALVWLVIGLLFVAIMTILSVPITSVTGAAGAALGIYPPAALGSQSAMLAAGMDADVLRPVLTSLALSNAGYRLKEEHAQIPAGTGSAGAPVAPGLEQ